MAVAPGTLTLADIQNKTWHLLREPGPDTGDTIVTTGDFAQSVVTRDANIALGEFIGDTGLAPSLSEKLFSGTIVAGLDYTLPTDLAALTRIEYQQAGSRPYPLEVVSFEEFDSRIGQVTGTTGPPLLCRMPYAGQIRFQPQPDAGNVAAGDQIFVYYTSLGTQLAALTDVPGIPAEFHVALVYKLLSIYWPRKNDPAQGTYYGRLYDEKVRKAKGYEFDSQRAGQFTLAGNGDGFDFDGPVGG